jgi:SAM-dependent methyltransferase
MSGRDARRLYGDLAWLWPIISPPEDYVAEGEHFARLITSHGVGEARTLLDLGCGGGHFMATLKRRFEVTGVDISDAMLDLSRALNPDCRHVLGDMRDVRLGQTFDAVFMGDAVEYMLTEGDLRAAFQTAWDHLRPGGILTLGLSTTAESFRQNSTTASTHSASDVDIAFVENDYDPDPTDTQYETTLVYLIRRPSGQEVLTDHHLSGVFPRETWFRLLGDVGFAVSEAPCAAGEEYTVLMCAR